MNYTIQLTFVPHRLHAQQSQLINARRALERTPKGETLQGLIGDALLDFTPGLYAVLNVDAASTVDLWPDAEIPQFRKES